MKKYILGIIRTNLKILLVILLVLACISPQLDGRFEFQLGIFAFKIEFLMTNPIVQAKSAIEHFFISPGSKTNFKVAKHGVVL